MEKEFIRDFIRELKVKNEQDLIIYNFLMDAYDRKYKLNDYA